MVDAGESRARAWELWSEQADPEVRLGKGTHWTESGVVERHLNALISGDPFVGWVQHSVDRYLEVVEAARVLSLGCGGGVLERQLLGLQPGVRVCAVDFSPGAVALAAAAARRSGQSIGYWVGDLNGIGLAAETFDLVIASMALHHTEDLEGLLDEVRRALRPGGVLVAMEYVGPDRHQWTPAQIEAINQVLALLPDRLKLRAPERREVKGPLAGPTPVAEMIRIDPTEAPRSEDILRVIGDRLELIELKPIGGSLLHILLQEIVGNFDETDDTDRSVLQLLCLIEQLLIEHGELAHDFAFCAARKPEAGRADAPARQFSGPLAKAASPPADAASRERAEIERLEAELRLRDRRIEEILGSRSWRWTAPLRRLVAALRGLRRRRGR